MEFELLPILKTMRSLYESPKDMQRFQTYLQLLQGDSNGDIELPIGGFNPMAGSHLLNKLDELLDLNAEEIAEKVLKEINQKLPQSRDVFKVVLNVADDLKGAWTHRYSTEYDSKFKLKALVNRNFCTPFLWTSESYDKESIDKRVKAAVFRCVYCKGQSTMKTLEDFVKQEAFVYKNTHDLLLESGGISDIDNIYSFYQENLYSENYSLIFNFFFGDEAARALEYPVFGNKKLPEDFNFTLLLK
jgi:hypothetical protein